MDEVYQVTPMDPPKGRMIKLDRMVQLELICGFHAGLENPLLNAILDRERRLPISKDNLMPPFLQSPTEVQGRISRARPFPIAKKMENFHLIQDLPVA